MPFTAVSGLAPGGRKRLLARCLTTACNEWLPLQAGRCTVLTWCSSCKQVIRAQPGLLLEWHAVGVVGCCASCALRRTS